MSDEPAIALPEADAAYLELIRRCPLMPLRSEAEFRRALATIHWLIDKAVAGLRTSTEEDYMDVLGDLVEAYEDEHYPMPSDLSATDSD